MQNLVKQYAEKLDSLLHELLPQNPNEADFRQRVDTLLQQFCTEAGSNPLPHMEYFLAPGRADAVFNRFVIEYERPGTSEAL
ncbi:MAG: hypothetical protein C4335_01830 [Armatimonadota bacterium]